MNYLEEIKQVKERVRQYNRQKKEYLSDMTYDIFEKFIMDISPEILDKFHKKIENANNLKELEKLVIHYGISYGISVHFIFKEFHEFSNIIHCETAILKIHDKEYGVVIIDEFLNYMHSIGDYQSFGQKYYEQRFDFDPEVFVNYYYEKLQELEYFGINYKILKKTKK